MVVEKRKDGTWAEIYWGDLSTEAQVRLITMMGDNGNFDVFPLTTINVTKEVK